MNKRQRKKQVTRRVRMIDRAFRKLLRPFIGQQANVRVLEKMGEIGADFIRAQLARPPSILHSFFILEPLLKPPYLRWIDKTHVVHWTGLHTEIDKGQTTRKRICDFGEALGALTTFPDDMPVTCIRCQVYQHERMQADGAED